MHHFETMVEAIVWWHLRWGITSETRVSYIGGAWISRPLPIKVPSIDMEPDVRVPSKGQ